MGVRREELKGWVVDIVFRHPDGRKERVRRRSPVQTRRGAEQYEKLLREEMLNPRPQQVKEAPTFSEASKYLMEHSVNNNKYSDQVSKRSILDHHLLPEFGRRRIDTITRRDIESYKAKKLKAGYSPKTINNHLTVLRKTLALAVEDDVLEHLPPVKWLKSPPLSFDYLNFEEADRLLEGAKFDPQVQAMIMTGLRTGLRQGEILALRWDDVDLVAGRLVVRWRDWRGNLDSPKSGRPREVPLSPDLIRVLKAHRHLRGEWVFCCEDGSRLTYGKLKRPLWTACKLAGLRCIGWHVLRHTFCSHLAMLGAPLKVVQEYAGHSDIRITMRYAHLCPQVGTEAISLLDRGKTLPIHVPYVSPTEGQNRKVLKLK